MSESMKKAHEEMAQRFKDDPEGKTMRVGYPYRVDGKEYATMDEAIDAACQSGKRRVVICDNTMEFLQSDPSPSQMKVNKEGTVVFEGGKITQINNFSVEGGNAADLQEYVKRNYRFEGDEEGSPLISRWQQAKELVECVGVTSDMPAFAEMFALALEQLEGENENESFWNEGYENGFAAGMSATLQKRKRELAGKAIPIPDGHDMVAFQAGYKKALDDVAPEPKLNGVWASGTMLVSNGSSLGASSLTASDLLNSLAGNCGEGTRRNDPFREGVGYGVGCDDRGRYYYKANGAKVYQSPSADGEGILLRRKKGSLMFPTLSAGATHFVVNGRIADTIYPPDYCSGDFFAADNSSPTVEVDGWRYGFDEEGAWRYHPSHFAMSNSVLDRSFASPVAEAMKERGFTGENVKVWYHREVAAVMYEAKIDGSAIAFSYRCNYERWASPTVKALPFDASLPENAHRLTAKVPIMRASGADWSNWASPSRIAETPDGMTHVEFPSPPISRDYGKVFAEAKSSAKCGRCGGGLESDRTAVCKGCVPDAE